MVHILGKEEQVRVEGGKAITKNAKTEEKRDHNSFKDNMSRSGVNIAKGSLQHDHKFNLI